MDRIPCQGCGIPIPDPGEFPTPDALLCDTCLEDRDHRDHMDKWARRYDDLNGRPEGPEDV